MGVGCLGIRMPRLHAFVLLALSSLAADVLAAERDLENDVRAANHRYELALVAADASVLNALYLPEFTYIGSGGIVRSKDEQIQAISSGSVDVIEGGSDDVQVRIHGDTAIVTGRFKGRARTSGSEFSFRERYSTVWIRQGNDWRLALEHGTVVKDK